ncbi:MAG: N6-L-threonylcarbamoyladenine synthase [Hyphomicrobiaceae bacterium]
MRVLGIETSCDDTAAAVIEDGRVLSNVVASQDELHAAYGGVVPELAARCHLENISLVLKAALERAQVSLGDLDAIAVTEAPGLVGSLLVGVSTAQGLALSAGLPVIGINHLEGHALSPLLVEDFPMPFLSAVVSGGHTAIYLVRALGDYVEVASTRDDSAGEAFDKGAKMMGLGYPGGRVIDDLARKGNRSAFKFPRGRVKNDRFAFSFSGMKTALRDFLVAHPEAALPDVCASFQEAIIDVLIDRISSVAQFLGVERVAVAGGVSANSRFRERMSELEKDTGLRTLFPPQDLCTDNGAMIAHAGWLRLCHNLASPVGEVRSRAPLGPRLEDV